MFNNSAAYKYEKPYKGLFGITQCWTNGTVTLQCVVMKIRYNIRLIKPYKYDTSVEYINPENIYDNFNILLPVIYLCIIY